jgi:hypothetical protein
MNKAEEVKVGQIWTDKDKRRRDRQIRIEKIEDGYAFCSSRQGSEGEFGSRLNRIQLSRFNKYALVGQGSSSSSSTNTTNAGQYNSENLSSEERPAEMKQSTEAA